MSSSSGNCQELLAQIIEVTGANPVEAQHLLSACDNNAEAAIALFFEQGGGTGVDAAVTVSGSMPAVAPTDAAIPAEPVVIDDDVRAPIAPVREQLIGPEDDNFFAASAPTGAAAGRIARASRVKVCPLRDFAREGELLEKELLQAVTTAATSGATSSSVSAASLLEPSVSSWPRNDRSAALVAMAANKPSTSRLGDLFRPPTDIAYSGTFQAARMRATQKKLWLLVNVQGDNFDSQVLNRDVWSDRLMRRLIKQQFLLWQIDAETLEGRRFVAFYRCHRMPYVCLIDPRTGEEVWNSFKSKQATLLMDLKEFLGTHKDFSQELDDNIPSTSKRSSTTECSLDTDDFDAMSNSSTVSNSSKRTRLMELTEEEQIALAIRNSMRENGANSKSAASSTNGGDDDEDEDDAASDFGSVEEFGDDDTKAACEHTSYEAKMGVSSEITMLKMRLLNSEGTEEMVQLRWPSDTLVRVLHLYIAQTHPHIPKNSYKLICAFPRKTLEAEHDGRSLKEMGLHPSANLHVTLED